MKTFLILTSSFCLCCLMATCGSFEGSYTDKQGVTYHGGIVVPKSVTSDAK